MSALVKLWPLVVLALLFFGARQIVVSNNEAQQEVGKLETQNKVLNQALVDETAVADVLAEQAETAREVVREQGKQLRKERTKYAQLNSELQRIAAAMPESDCFHQPVDARVSGLLHAGSSAGKDASAGSQTGGQSGAASDARMDHRD